MTILVIYATRYGSTTVLAETITDTLRQAGYDAELFIAEKMPDPMHCEAIILGSPLYLGKWLRSLVEYINRYKGIFDSVPHAVFTVGYTLREPGPMELAAARLAELEFQHVLSPVYSGYFGGNLEINRLSGADRDICQMVGLPDGDFRDTTKVAAWTLEALDYLFPSFQEAGK
ncbi:MAG: hypothetical protein JXA44_13745 [Methanospirillaceae archaeon]|nr:hypothetical protein [Methanospirillaceae archaeon]